MQFDVIIGNPPYQEMAGGGSYVKSSVPVYHKFVLKGMELNPGYMTFIIPSRWLSSINTLNTFRTKILESKGLNKIVCYKNSREVFKAVDIAGGVMYFLYSSNFKYDKTEVIARYQGNINKAKRSLLEYTYINRDGSKEYMAIVDNNGCKIINKVISKGDGSISDSIINSNPFGLETDFDSSHTGDIKVVLSKGRSGYTVYQDILYNKQLINKYKVICLGLNPDRGGYSRGLRHSVISGLMVLEPGEVCTASYIILNTFDNKDEADNFVKYMETKFVRYLVLQTINNIHLIFKNFIFVPELDWNRVWEDTELYKRYNLESNDIEEISKYIREWRDGETDN